MMMMKENRYQNLISYFRYHFLQSGKFILFISIVAGIISFITAINGQPVYRHNEGGEYVLKYYDPTLGFSMFVIGFLCFLVPVLQFSFFKKRRNLDYIYSMPISRTEVGAVHYAVGLLEVFIPFTVSYLINFLVFASWGFADNKLLPFIPFYFWCLLFGWIFYSIFCFAFNEANTVTDGCVFMGLWTFIFMLIVERFDIFSKSVYFIPFVILSNMANVYDKRATKGADGTVWIHPDAEVFRLISLILFVIAVLMTVYLLVSFGRRRTERAEEISDSPFGYISMIPIYAFLLAVPEADLVIRIVITVATIVGYTIFRRGVKYKVFDFLVMGTMFGLCAISIIKW